MFHLIDKEVVVSLLPATAILVARLTSRSFAISQHHTPNLHPKRRPKERESPNRPNPYRLTNISATTAIVFFDARLKLETQEKGGDKMKRFVFFHLRTGNPVMKNIDYLLYCRHFKKS